MNIFFLSYRLALRSTTACPRVIWASSAGRGRRSSNWTARRGDNFVFPLWEIDHEYVGRPFQISPGAQVPASQKAAAAGERERGAGSAAAAAYYRVLVLYKCPSLRTNTLIEKEEATQNTHTHTALIIIPMEGNKKKGKKLLLPQPTRECL